MAVLKGLLKRRRRVWVWKLDSMSGRSMACDEGARDHEKLARLFDEFAAFALHAVGKGNIDAFGIGGQGVNDALGEIADLHFAAIGLLIKGFQRDGKIVPLMGADVLHVKRQ